MRKITEQSVNAFLEDRNFKKSNMQVETNLASQVYDGERNVHDGIITTMKLFGKTIAYKNSKGKILISSCGWQTATTKERLNAIPGVNIVQRNFIWYLNGKEWDGNLVAIKERYKPQ